MRLNNNAIPLDSNWILTGFHWILIDVDEHRKLCKTIRKDVGSCIGFLRLVEILQQLQQFHSLNSSHTGIKSGVKKWPRGLGSRFVLGSDPGWGSFEIYLCVL